MGDSWGSLSVSAPVEDERQESNLSRAITDVKLKKENGEGGGSGAWQRKFQATVWI